MIGILCTVLAKALKVPTPLLLLVLGLFIGSLKTDGVPLIGFDEGFVFAVAVFALIMLVFDSSSRIKLKETRDHARQSMKLINIFLLASVIIVPLFAASLFFGGIKLYSILFSMIFAVLAIETDIGSVLTMFKEYAKEKSTKVLVFLESEANLNTAFVVIIPFVILNLITDINYTGRPIISTLFSSMPLFIVQVLIGLGVGILVGLVILKFMRDKYSSHLTPIVIIAAVLASYVLSIKLGGEGILSVAAMGFMFGNVYVTGKDQFEEFSGMLTDAIEIFVFMLLGILVNVHFSFTFVLKSLFLFVIIVLIRMVTTFLVLKDKEYGFHDKLFISLNMPKGIAIAIAGLALTAYPFPEAQMVTALIVTITIYSLVLSYATELYLEKFFEHNKAGAPTKLKMLKIPTAIPAKKVKARSRSKKAKPAKKKAKKKKR